MEGRIWDKCQEQAHKSHGLNAQITYEMLLGWGQYNEMQNHLNYVYYAYEQIRLCGRTGIFY